MVAVSPPGVAVVDVTLTGPGGTSEAVPADQFTYRSAAPKLGRCMKPGAKQHGRKAGRRANATPGGHTGEYSDSGCTESSKEGRFDWKPGPGGKPTFVLKGGPVTLQTASGTDVTCKRSKGTGEYSSARSSPR